MQRLVVALALFFCGGPSAQSGEAHDLMQRFTVIRQSEILAEQVRDVGYECSAVKRLFFKGENSEDDSDYFTIRCAGDLDYMISIENFGGMQATVMDCPTVELLGIACWTPF